MTIEWISLIIPFVTLIIGYWLGLKSGKIQILKDYTKEVVSREYPLLHSELKRNTERLDDFPEKPDESTNFAILNDIYQKGLFGFIEKHHHDLFQALEYFRTDILPEFDELHELRITTKNNVFHLWSGYLEANLPKGISGERISSDLIMAINPYYLLPHFLNERYEEIKNKIEARIWEGTSHFYQQMAQRSYVVEGQNLGIDINNIRDNLIEMATPHFAKLLDFYKRLKRKNDEIAEDRIFPLLQKYISNPV